MVIGYPKRLRYHGGGCYYKHKYTNNDVLLEVELRFNSAAHPMFKKRIKRPSLRKRLATPDLTGQLNTVQLQLTCPI